MNLEGIHDYLAAKRRGSTTAPGSRLRSKIPPAALRLLATARVESRALPVTALARLTGSSAVILDVPRFGGNFEIDRRSHIFRRLLVDSFERELAELVRALVEPSDTVVDVGANIGLFTVLAARCAPRGRVLSVEASPGAAEMLVRNVARNHLDNVRVYEGAVSNHADGVTLHLSEGNEEYASLGGLNHPNAPKAARVEVKVPSQTLDALLAQHELTPQLVKIDVEGAEGLVFEGAQRMLDQARPLLLCELDDRLLKGLGHRSQDVIGSLASHGYHVHDAHDGMPLDANRTESFVGEIVALPA